MNFTRDPIIETVITPKEGFKLLVRASGTQGSEEYQVDAIEVVSFGKSMFFRSLEKPKAFLLPVTDYEVVEVKETRVVLKKASIEKPIKIAGGKRPQEEAEEPRKEVVHEQKKEVSEKEEEPKKGKKRKKSRSKKGNIERKEESAAPMEKVDQPAPPPRKMRALIPPPSALISDSISKYKHAFSVASDMIPEGAEGSTTGENFSSEEISEPKQEMPHDYSPPEQDEMLEEYHPHEDDTIDHDLLQDQDMDEEDPILRHHHHDEE